MIFIRKIKGYDNYYVDEYGRIYSDKSGQVKELKPWLDGKKRYYMVSLCDNGLISKRLVHRLVAQAYIPNLFNLPEIHHIDNNTKNNYTTNLKWCDRKYNMHQCFKTMSPIRNYRKCYVKYEDNHIGDFLSKLDACRYISKTYKVSLKSLIRYGKSKGYEIIERCND